MQRRLSKIDIGKIVEVANRYPDDDRPLMLLGLVVNDGKQVAQRSVDLAKERKELKEKAKAMP